MKSRVILNLVLLAIIGLLGALAFFEPGKKKAEHAPIAAVDENALTRITLKNKDTIVFEKKDGRWRLAAPFKAPANEIRVRQLIDIGKSRSEAEYPVKGEDLGKFELDRPKATLTLGNTTLAFGGSDPIAMRRYVQIGETLYLVADDFFHHLMASATDYVDKKLLPESASVKEIFIPGVKTTLGADGKWVKEPADSKANPPELAAVWATARAIDVKRLEKPPQGDVVRIGLTEGNPIEFVIVQREPDLLLARQDLGLQYELTGETARQLLNLPKVEPQAGLRPAAPGDAGNRDADEEGEDEVAPEVGEDDGGGADKAKGAGDE